MNGKFGLRSVGGGAAMGWPALGWVIREASKGRCWLSWGWKEKASVTWKTGERVLRPREQHVQRCGEYMEEVEQETPPGSPSQSAQATGSALSWVAIGSYSGSWVHVKILLSLVSDRKLPQTPDTQSSLFYLTFLFFCFGLAPVQPASTSFITLVTACGFDQELRNCVLVCSKFYFQISVTLFLPLYLSLAPFSIVFYRENKCSVLPFKKSLHVTAGWGSRV